MLKKIRFKNLLNYLEIFLIPFGFLFFLLVSVIKITHLSTGGINSNVLFPISFFFLNISLVYILRKKTFFEKLTLNIVLIGLAILAINTYSNFIPNQIKLLTVISTFIFLGVILKQAPSGDLRERSKYNKKEIVYLLLLIILGFFIRIYRSGHLSFWVDEYYHVFAGESFLKTGLPTLPNFTTYFRAILYTGLNSISFYLFGVSELSSRLASVLLGTLLIPVTYFLSKKIFDSKKITYLSTIIITFSDFAIFYSRYNRFYIALSFLIILNIFLFWKVFFENKKRNFLFILFFCAIILPGFDSKSSIFLFLCIPIALLLDKKLVKNIYIWIYTLISILSYSFFNFIEKIGTVRDTPVLTKININLPIPDSILSIIYPHFDLFFTNFIYKYFTIIFIFLIFGLILYVKKIFTKNLTDKIKLFILFYTTLSFILISKFFINIKNYTWDQRHISFLFPLLLLSSLITLEEILKRINNKFSLQKNLLLIVFGFSIVNVIGIYKVLYMKYGDSLIGTRYLTMKAEPYRSDYKTPYQFVNENYKEGDIIIADNFMFLGNLYLKYPINYPMKNDNVLSIEKIINENKRIWIIDTTYDMKKFHAKYRWENIYKFLQANEEKVVYYGEDSKTRVFMFSK